MPRTALHKTKIVATRRPVRRPTWLPASWRPGVDIFRLNFSHGDNAQKQKLIHTIRQASEKTGRQIGILADLQGPKIRTGKMADDAMTLTKGQEVVITTEDVPGRDGVIPTVYHSLPSDVHAGSRILLDDGSMESKVVAIKGERVRCTVVTGGVLKNNKGINLPGVNVSTPSLTEKDLVDLDFALEADVDFVALSFVRTAEDVEQIKRIIYLRGKNTPVVAKIEKPEALHNFKKILQATDAVMVARGDLGVEIEAEKVPVFQKRSSRPAMRPANRSSPPPRCWNPWCATRAHQGRDPDVANAIEDGTDAVIARVGRPDPDHA